MEIIPAIDMIDGHCVRLSKGDYDTKKIYNENPLEVARMFEDNGIRRLHLVDLDGAKAGHIVNHRVLESIATRTSLVIDFGGGLKTGDDLRIAFESGAAMVTGGSIAVRNRPEFESWIDRYGSDRIILGADAKDGRIAVQGWQEQTSLELMDFVAEYHKRGIRKVICTDIGRDGMLQGPATDLYASMLEALPDLWLVASGGVGSLADLEALAERGVPAAIVGKAIYEHRIALADLHRFA